MFILFVENPTDNACDVDLSIGVQAYQKCFNDTGRSPACRVLAIRTIPIPTLARFNNTYVNQLSLDCVRTYNGDVLFYDYIAQENILICLCSYVKTRFRE